MNFSDKMNQKIIYWGNPFQDGWGGHTYDAPVELDARWEDKAEQIITYLGEETVSKSIIYLINYIVPGGYIYLGEETELDSDHDNPENISDAYKILKICKIPSINASENLWVGWL